MWIYCSIYFVNIYSELIEGDNENRKTRREVKKLMEEKQQMEVQNEKLLTGADPKSYMQILEGNG